MIDSFANLVGLGATDPAFWMPLAFLLLFFLVILAGTVLDGFDIGVGVLSLFAPDYLRPRMMSLLSPWRDANEFWLFLGLGLFVCAFPKAWGSIMGGVYLPLCLLAAGVFLRSVAFEFRLRAPQEYQVHWQRCFGAGSILTAFAHGLLLGQVAVGFQSNAGYAWFSVFIGFCAVAAYALLGASWLIMREAGELRARAVIWGRRSVRWFAAGAVAVSVVLAFVNAGVLLKWSDGPYLGAVLFLWAAILIGFVSIEMCLQRMINSSYRTTALPFLLTLLIMVAVLCGLAFSFFPFLILDELTIWDAAASVTTLSFILTASLIALPIILIFNIWVYWRMFGLSRPPLPPSFKG